MGYNVSAAIIKPQVSEEHFQMILQAIGFKDIRFNSTELFGYPVERDHENLYIGNYNGSTILYDCIPLDEKREANGFTKIENILIHLFPDRKIIVFYVVDAVPGYYVHIIDGGKTIRRRGCDDIKQMQEEGEELPIEKGYYDSRYLNEDNIFVYTVTRSYKKSDGTIVTRQEEYLDNAIGGVIAFDLCTDFIGHRFEDLGNTPFTIYKFSRIEEKVDGTSIVKPDNVPTTRQRKKWWEFWK